MQYSPTMFSPAPQASDSQSAAQLSRRGHRRVQSRTNYKKAGLLTTVSGFSAIPFTVNASQLPARKEFWQTIHLPQPSHHLATLESIVLGIASELCNTSLNYQGIDNFTRRFVRPRNLPQFICNLLTYPGGLLTILPSVSSSFYHAPVWEGYLSAFGSLFTATIYADSLYNWFASLPTLLSNKRGYNYAVSLLNQTMRLQSAELIRKKIIMAINRASAGAVPTNSELSVIKTIFHNLNPAEKREALFNFMLLNGIKLPNNRDRLLLGGYIVFGASACAITAIGGLLPTLRVWRELSIAFPSDWGLSFPGTIMRFVLFEASCRRFYFKIRRLGLLRHGDGRVIACSLLLMLFSLTLGMISSAGYLNTIISGKGMQQWFDMLMPAILIISNIIISILNGSALYDFLTNILYSLWRSLGQEEILFLEQAFDAAISEASKEVLDAVYGSAHRQSVLIEEINQGIEAEVAEEQRLLTEQTAMGYMSHRFSLS